MMRKANKLPRTTEYKQGPEPEGIRVCIKCQQPIEASELWLKEWAANREYAVGVHVTCAIRDEPGKRRFRDCGICGHQLLENEAAAALHLLFCHKIKYGVDLQLLLG
jgi:hypothetical protein